MVRDGFDSYPRSVPFVVQRSAERGVCVIAVRGDLDIVSSYTLASAVEDVPRRTVLDLSECRYVDSTGLRVIVGLAERLGSGFAVVRAPDSSPARVFELAGLAGLLTFEDTRRDGVRAVRRG